MRIERVQRTIDAAKQLVKENFEGQQIDSEPDIVIATALLIAVSDLVDSLDNVAVSV